MEGCRVQSRNASRALELGNSAERFGVHRTTVTALLHERVSASAGLVYRRVDSSLVNQRHPKEGPLRNLGLGKTARGGREQCARAWERKEAVDLRPIWPGGPYSVPMNDLEVGEYVIDLGTFPIASRAVWVRCVPAA